MDAISYSLRTILNGIILFILMLNMLGVVENYLAMPIVFVGSIILAIMDIWIGRWLDFTMNIAVALIAYYNMRNVGGSGGSLFNFNLPRPKWTRR